MFGFCLRFLSWAAGVSRYETFNNERKQPQNRVVPQQKKNEKKTTMNVYFLLVDVLL